jgi:S-adenosylmethionine/arginine decarboxylase-like enzyme
MNFGTLLTYDLKDIDGDKSKDEVELNRLIHVLVVHIMNMSIIGKPVFEYFENNLFNNKLGLVGFSITCIISLSSITFHICDIQKTAYIDIFTCCRLTKDMTDEINRTLNEFFRPSLMRNKIIERGIGWN